MDYRSDVKYVLYGTRQNVVGALSAYQLQHSGQVGRAWSPGHWSRRYNQDKDFMIFEFSATHVKWYDDYEEVQAFTEFLNFIADYVEQLTYDVPLGTETEHLCWEFVRLGENDDDNERNASDYNDFQIYLTRTISFTHPTPLKTEIAAFPI